MQITSNSVFLLAPVEYPPPTKSLQTTPTELVDGRYSSVQVSMGVESTPIVVQEGADEKVSLLMFRMYRPVERLWVLDNQGEQIVEDTMPPPDWTAHPSTLMFALALVKILLASNPVSTVNSKFGATKSSLIENDPPPSKGCRHNPNHSFKLSYKSPAIPADDAGS